jgi:hypothetical protein
MGSRNPQIPEVGDALPRRLGRATLLRLASLLTHPRVPGVLAGGARRPLSLVQAPANYSSKLLTRLGISMNEDEGEIIQMKLGTECHAGEMDPIEDDERDNPVVERDQLPSRGQDQSQARAYTVLTAVNCKSHLIHVRVYALI